MVRNVWCENKVTSESAHDITSCFPTDVDPEWALGKDKVWRHFAIIGMNENRKEAILVMVNNKKMTCELHAALHNDQSED